MVDVAHQNKCRQTLFIQLLVISHPAWLLTLTSFFVTDLATCHMSQKCVALLLCSLIHLAIPLFLSEMNVLIAKSAFWRELKHRLNKFCSKCCTPYCLSTIYPKTLNFRLRYINSIMAVFPAQLCQLLQAYSLFVGHKIFLKLNIHEKSIVNRILKHAYVIKHANFQETFPSFFSVYTTSIPNWKLFLKQTDKVSIKWIVLEVIYKCSQFVFYPKKCSVTPLVLYLTKYSCLCFKWCL